MKLLEDGVRLFGGGEPVGALDVIDFGLGGREDDALDPGGLEFDVFTGSDDVGDIVGEDEDTVAGAFGDDFKLAVDVHGEKMAGVADLVDAIG